MATAPTRTNAPPAERPEPLSAQERGALRGLLDAYSCVAKRLDADLEAAHALPLTSFEVLALLHDAPQGRMRMCDLASSIQLSRSGLTRLVDRLERDGLLERCSCDHDARGAYACLTPDGRRQLSAARATHLAGVREHFLSHLRPGELAMLSELGDRVR